MNTQEKVDRMLKLRTKYTKWISQASETTNYVRRRKLEIKASRCMEKAKELAMEVRGENPGER